jgi:hypothetical protein
MTPRVITFLRMAALILTVLSIGLIPYAGQAQASCGQTMETALIAGQNIPVGTVAVENDGQYLYVTYQTEGDWLITETHLDVATRPEDLKQTPKGNPIAGRFAYKSEHQPGVTTVTHTIDLAAWPPGTQLYLAAHSVVVSAFGSETAWGEGMDFPGNNWAMYFPYQVQSCEPPPVEAGTIDMLPSSVEVDEFGVSVILHLVRSNGSVGQATVVLDPQDISATLGEDYVLDTSPVTFADGETEKSVEIFILDDTNPEGDERFQVRISNVTGAAIGESAASTCVIIDDDYGQDPA